MKDYRKHQFLPVGFFFTSEGNEVWLHESDSVGSGCAAGYEPDITNYGYTILPPAFWQAAYWHGYKVTGAYIYNYSTDPSYADCTVVLWINSFVYHPEHDLLPVDVYKFSKED